MAAFYKQSGNLPSGRGLYHNKLRSMQNIDVPRPFLTLYKKSYEYIAPKLYNMLPHNLKGLSSYNKFKKDVLKWLFTITNIEDMIHEYPK